MKITIGGKMVDNNSPVLIIAEAGINHDGKLNQAFQLIDMAAECGADIVKFQIFTARRMYPMTAGLYKTANGKNAEIYSLIKKMEIPEEWISKLIKHCKEKNIGFLCTTCDETSTELLDKYGVDSFKIASGEITHIPLLRHAAKTGKTIILSEGASNFAEVTDAIYTIKSTGNSQIALLHCTAEYPAKPEDCNVNIIETYRRTFPDVVIGFSDHTMHPSDAPVQAVLKGAKIIEKHITLNRNFPGADHCFALERQHLKKLVDDIRYAEKYPEKIEENPVIGGRTDKIILPDEEKLRTFVHRGIFASRHIEKGEVFSSDNIVVLRPGNSKNGIEPRFFEMLIDKKVRANKSIGTNSPIQWDDVLCI